MFPKQQRHLPQSGTRPGPVQNRSPPARRQRRPLGSRGDGGPCQKGASDLLFTKRWRPLRSQKERTRAAQSQNSWRPQPQKGRAPGVHKAAKALAPKWQRPHRYPKPRRPPSNSPEALEFRKTWGPLPQSRGHLSVPEAAEAPMLPRGTEARASKRRKSPAKKWRRLLPGGGGGLGGPKAAGTHGGAVSSFLYATPPSH